MSQLKLKNELNPKSATRKPQRITISVPQVVYDKLGEISFKQGRSMSNLACFLIEEETRKYT